MSRFHISLSIIIILIVVMVILKIENMSLWPPSIVKVMMKVTQGRYDSFGVEGTEQGAPELGIGIESDLLIILIIMVMMMIMTMPMTIIIIMTMPMPMTIIKKDQKDENTL